MSIKKYFKISTLILWSIIFFVLLSINFSGSHLSINVDVQASEKKCYKKYKYKVYKTAYLKVKKLKKGSKKDNIKYNDLKVVYKKYKTLSGRERRKLLDQKKYDDFKLYKNYKKYKIYKKQKSKEKCGENQKIKFIYPVKNKFGILMNYGKQIQHNYEYFSEGILFATIDDDGVYAVADGEVLEIGDMGRYGFGKWVLIKHKNGVISMYGHLDYINVKKGQIINMNKKLGKAGRSGLTMGTSKQVYFSLFIEKTFKLKESSVINGLFVPTGERLNPYNYLNVN